MRLFNHFQITDPNRRGKLDVAYIYIYYIEDERTTTETLKYRNIVSWREAGCKFLVDVLLKRKQLKSK